MNPTESSYGKLGGRHKKIDKLRLEENKSTASTMLDSSGNFSVSDVISL